MIGFRRSLNKRNKSDKVYNINQHRLDISVAYEVIGENHILIEKNRRLIEINKRLIQQLADLKEVLTFLKKKRKINATS